MCKVTIERFTTERLSKDNATDLESHVISWINAEAEGGVSVIPHVILLDQREPKPIKAVVLDLMKDGCQSYVSELVSTRACRDFVAKFQREIEILVTDWIDEGGVDMISFLWDDREGNNVFTIDRLYEKLACAGFEETARSLMIEVGYDQDF